jgi:K+-transporting ATPase c subunit
MCPTAVPFPFLLLFFSCAHGITYNCTTKNSPSSSCCSGEITLDPTMTTIASVAFQSCSGLTGPLIIPSSVTIIGQYAFQGCSGLTGSLIIPSSVTSIGQYAFDGCSGFNGSLIIPSNDEYYSIYISWLFWTQRFTHNSFLHHQYWYFGI